MGIFGCLNRELRISGLTKVVVRFLIEVAPSIKRHSATGSFDEFHKFSTDLERNLRPIATMNRNPPNLDKMGKQQGAEPRPVSVGALREGSDNVTIDPHAADVDPIRLDLALVLKKNFGIEIRFAPDRLSPPVDIEKIAKYLRNELSVDESEEICHLIGSFRPWYDACGALFSQDLAK
jgi:hypothetical protein